MALARGKIIKANNEEPDEIEKQISQVRESFLVDQFRSIGFLLELPDHLSGGTSISGLDVNRFVRFIY